MMDELDLLSLSAPAGDGQANDPEDIAALDNSLRRIRAYAPPPEYASEPQRYATAPMITALENFQAQNGLKVDRYANPGGPTERAINNHLLEKPRGAGLLWEPPAPLAAKVGNGLDNRREDVATVQRLLGALGTMPEDPHDRPHGFIDERTLGGITNFQKKKGLTTDGWLAPGGETERALRDAVADLARAKGGDWFRYAERAGRAQARMVGRHSLGDTANEASTEFAAYPADGANSNESPTAIPVMTDINEIMRPMLEGGWSWRGGGPGRGTKLILGPGPGAPPSRHPVPPLPIIPPSDPRSSDSEQSGGKTELLPPRTDDAPYRGRDSTKPPLDPKRTGPAPYPSEPPLKLPEREEIRPETLKPEDWTLITPAISPWSASDLAVFNRGNSRTQGRLTGMREVGEDVAKERSDVDLIHAGGARDEKGINRKEYYAPNPLKEQLGIKTTAGSALADLTFENRRTGEFYHISLYRVTSGTKPRKEEVAQAIKLAVNTKGQTQLIVMVPNVHSDGFVDADSFKRFLHATLDSLRGAPKFTDMSDPAARAQIIRFFTEMKPK